MDANDLDQDACYRALQTRDARFDGRFYTGVVSTGIYCRPICPARPPKRENCVFLPSAAAAHQLGFRPCLRCRPETAPGVAGWQGTAATVSRALSLIAEGALDDASIEGLGDRLGIGERHLRRLFDRHVGASPVAVAQANRILFAKKLITETALPMTDVALASGFGSLRRFNAVMLETYGKPPSALRQRSGPAPQAGVRLKLPFKPPFDWDALAGFLGQRAIPGVERFDGSRYIRTIAIGEARGRIEVGLAKGSPHLDALIDLSDISKLAQAVSRLRRVFDLDADSLAIDSQLANDPTLATKIAARPGVRVPGAWDPFELAVRAVLGQQISVAAARTLAGRLAARWGTRLAPEAEESGTPTLLFPKAIDVTEADFTEIGLTKSRAKALRGIAQAVAADPNLLTPSATLDETIAKLCALPGIGPWTAHYIAMRALGEPDAFPAADLGLMKAMETEAGRPSAKELEAHSRAWQPWRAYGALRLWLQPTV